MNSIFHKICLIFQTRQSLEKQVCTEILFALWPHFASNQSGIVLKGKDQGISESGVESVCEGLLNIAQNTKLL